MAWRLYSVEREAKTEDYIYSPLDLTKNEFRVLGLHPSSDPDSDIYCDIHQGEVGEKVNTHGRMLGYQALSYVWGEPEPRKAIYIDQRRILVGPNLHAALRRLRHERYGMLLWVDAVCIDQSNIEERNHQVKLMNSIYKNAKIVFMWLGEEADSSDLAMDILSLCENQIVQGARIKAAGRWSRAEHEAQGKALVKLFRDEIYDKHWEAVAHLFVREYWARVWILQEVLLASTATVCCGSKTVQWTYVGTLLVIWSQSLSEFSRGPAYKAFDVAGWARHLGGLYLESKSRTLSLLDGLLISRQRWATRKVDHVYGILGIVELQGYHFEPDYGKLTMAVFRETVQHVIQRDKNLNILTACKRHDLNEPERVKDLQAHIAANSAATEAFIAAESKLQSPDIMPVDANTEQLARSPQKAESSTSQIVSIARQQPPITQNGPTIQEMQNNLVSKMKELTDALKDINFSDRLERGLTSWPTWIPDWTRRLLEESYSEILYLLLSEPRTTFYQASGSSNAKAVFPEDPLLLITHGGNFDRVEQVSPYCIDDIEQPTDQRVYDFSKKNWDWYCSVSSAVDNPYGGAKARKMAYRGALILGRDVMGKEEDFSDRVFYDMFWEMVETGKVAEDIYTNDAYTYYNNDDKGAADTIRVNARIQRATWYMKYRSRFFVTRKGYIGRGPPEILPGDQVCLLLGGRVPFILREDADGKYRMVGESCKFIQKLFGLMILAH